MQASARIRITRVMDADDLGKQLEPRMRNLANAVARRMQRLVPKRSWVLHDTIIADTERTGGKVVAVIGVGGANEAPYWEYVERGTSKQKAQPYMRPAFLQTKSRDLNNEGTPAPKHGTPAERRAVQSANRRHNAAVKRAESAGES